MFTNSSRVTSPTVSFLKAASRTWTSKPPHHVGLQNHDYGFYKGPKILGWIRRSNAGVESHHAVKNVRDHIGIAITMCQEGLSIIIYSTYSILAVPISHRNADLADKRDNHFRTLPKIPSKLGAPGDHDKSRLLLIM